MSDHDAIQLIFDRGLTTADKINLNAGRGVGMSIVKEAIESHGGTVQVRTEPQRGAAFTISLPIKNKRSELATAPEPKPETAAQVPLVLIVDDSASIRRQSTKLVEQAGLRVITANNGAEALELLLNGDWEPNLILSDVEMPQIDGWGFLEYIKTDENFGHIPMVMVTSLDSDEHRNRAAGLGANDYLIKPLRESDLARVIDTFLNAAA
jgi:CheY-like chemotaxis protein